MAAHDPTSLPIPPTAALTESQVRKVATLSRLALTDEQVCAMQPQLAHVLEYMDRLKSLNLEGVQPLTHVSDETNRLDDDVPGPTLSNEVLMGMAPRSSPPFIEVPKVIDEGGGA